MQGILAVNADPMNQQCTEQVQHEMTDCIRNDGGALNQQCAGQVQQVTGRMPVVRKPGTMNPQCTEQVQLGRI